MKFRQTIVQLKLSQLTVNVVSTVERDDVIVVTIKVPAGLRHVTRFTSIAQRRELARILHEADRRVDLKALDCVHPDPVEKIVLEVDAVGEEKDEAVEANLP